ncbi:hypothetical protein [Syntrophomonas palmitatica]|uniref:hypothetical protein n=1 Tax=Syntrophomonas palmitatica TaxID=402877 RepID=UPI000AB8DD81|nr:hypothetical protein [Syntrophomonas palmitatica]
MRLLRSKRGQAAMEILVCILGVVIIAFLISQQMRTPIGNLHDKAIDGIVKITGSGM